LRSKLHCRQTHNFHNVSNSAQVTAGFHRPWILHEYITYAANVPINVSYISIYENFEISSFKCKTSTLTILTWPPDIRFFVSDARLVQH